MSADPLVAHSTPEHQWKGLAWFIAGTCQFWIWLNALGALAFRFWVVDRFNYTTFVEEKLWPGLFLLESLIQLCLAIVAGVGLFTIPRDRKFWGLLAAAVFSVFVYAVIVAAWALVIVPEEYGLAATVGLYGAYLTIPAVAFAVYCAVVIPSTVSLWIYAVIVTIALKCAAVIMITVPSVAFISYVVIILIALVSVVLPLRFGFTKSDPRISEGFANEPVRDDAAP
jgi:hypothetical protein